MLNPGREPWHKMRGETGPAFEAFALYRDLGLSRSLMKAAQILKEDTTRKGTVASIRTHLGSFSSKYHWQDRVDAYDRYVDQRERTEVERRRDEILARMGKSGELLSYTALRALHGDPQINLAPLHPSNLDPNDIATFLKLSADLELRGLGQITDSKGAFLMTPAQVERLIMAFLGVALNYIEPERQEAFLRDAAAATSGKELT